MADQTSGVSFFSFHLRVIGPFKKRLFLVLFLVILDTVLASLGIGMVLPVFQALIDPSQESALLKKILFFYDMHEPDSLITILAVMTIVLFFSKAAVSMLTTIVNNDFIQKLRFYWIARIGENYLQVPLLNITGQKQGDLLNDWFNETLSASRFYKSSLNYLSSLALAFALLVLGLIINWQAMVSMVGVGAIVVIIIRMLTYKRSAILSKEELRVNQALNTTMLEDLSNVRDLKLMTAESQRLQHIFNLSADLKSIFVRGAVLAEIPRVSGEFLAVFFLMGFVLISNDFIEIKHQDMLPMIAFFFIAFYRLVAVSSKAMTSRVRAMNELHSVYKIQKLLEQEQQKEKLNSGFPIGRIETDILFQDLSFQYELEKTALKVANAVIPKGKLTLLIGPSGSGKSTLLDLLMRLIEPSSGKILVNGRLASDFSLHDWRNCFGYVSQDASLFNGSINMNMLLAKPDASKVEIHYICGLVGADDFINNLPDGYNTNVGDRGYSLSGGQRKRIAIARALIREPSVLILDEATTSFEQKLEQELLTGLRTALPDLTIIQVTHRIHLTDSVDWIVIIENGHVIACGSKKDVALVDYGCL